MIKLETLPKLQGTEENRKRVGRGESSGWGKTSGRGHKGAQSRSGYKSRVGFEGGQTPLARRLPKRGFSHARFDVPIVALNVVKLNCFEDGVTVDRMALVDAGLVPRSVPRVKILGNGDIEKKLNIQAQGFSASARKKIEAAGGTCEVVSHKAQPSTEDTTETD